MKKIAVGWLEIGPQERKAINEVLSSGRISEGKKTFAFEKAWSDFVGVRHCVATSSGTGALITVLTAMKYLYDLKDRPKVITTPLTYIADANAIILTGFSPVFADIEPDTFCISPEKIEEILTQAKDPSEFSIILAVDLMGFPARLDKIRKIAKKYDLLVIEDAAQAHGTLFQGKRCGSSADAAIFSFYIAHNIQAGEMGAITTDSEEIYHLAKKIKANGRFCKCSICSRVKGPCHFLPEGGPDEDFDPRFLHDVIGYNFKTMEFQAALGLVQMKRIAEIIRKRQENVRYLNEGLKKYERLLKLPVFGEDYSYLAYPIVIRRPDVFSRKAIRSGLEKNHIETRPLFGCIPTQQPAYGFLKKRYTGKLPNAEYVGEQGFYIGCHQYLGKKDLDQVIFAFDKVIGKGRIK